MPGRDKEEPPRAPRGRRDGDPPSGYLVRAASALFGPARQDGLVSRRAMVRALESAIRLHRPSSVTAVLVLSLSRSDSIDAILDSPASVAIAQRIVERIRHCLREQDRICMVGHDEIWVLLEHLPSESVANLAANRLTAEMTPPFLVAGTIATVRPCIGVAMTGGLERDAQMLLRAASQARNRARILHAPFSVATAEDYRASINADLVAAVEYALQHNALRLAYQPKVSLRDRKVAGVEALVRWPQSLTPVLTPATLVHVAEQFGMMPQLTRHVLHTALREYVTHLGPAGIERVWVNISAAMLADPDLLSSLTQVLDVWNAPPSVLGLEITESMLITDVDQSVEALSRLSERGFALAVDDFGTGYSSLAYLRRLPIDELKIDKVFVRDLARSDSDAQIVRAIIGLAHQFQLSVIAEGAEDEATLLRLEEMGCDQVQGYVFAKGLGAEEFVVWHREFARPVRRVSR